MRKLVALDLPGNHLFQRLVEQCFENGDAVLPLDQRLSRLAKEKIIKLLRPGLIVTSPILSDKKSVSPGGYADYLPCLPNVDLGLNDLEVIKLEDGVDTESRDGAVIATSGTTGIPKGVILSIDALTASAKATNKYLGVNNDQDKWLCCLPVSHVGGFSVITRGILTGTKVEVIPKFDFETTIRLLEEENVNLTSLVPTTLERLGETYAGQFRKILLGGSKLPEINSKNIVKTYGMTETASGVVYDGNLLDKVELKFRHIDSTLSVNSQKLTEGEICLRGEMLFRNYRFADQDPKNDGWFPTGDAGRVDKNGKLVVDGRIAELIITGGEKVWPAHVEKVIARVSGVAEVVVAGIDDKTWGQKVTAFILPAEGTDLPDMTHIKGSVREEIGPWAVPKSIYFVKRIEKTAIGKPIKAKLISAALTSVPADADDT